MNPELKTEMISSIKTIGQIMKYLILFILMGILMLTAMITINSYLDEILK